MLWASDHAKKDMWSEHWVAGLQSGVTIFHFSVFFVAPCILFLMLTSCADILFLANNTLTDIVFLIVIAAMVVRIEYTV
jgi:hypothetical protein